MEVINSFIAWLQEYGDVLGGIGSIFAVITLLLTNGKLIAARLRGEIVTPEGGGAAAGRPVRAPSNLMSLAGFGKPAKNSITLLPLEVIGHAEAPFIEGLGESVRVDLAGAGFALPDMAHRSLSQTPDRTAPTADSEKAGKALAKSVIKAGDDAAMSADLMVRYALRITIRSDGSSARLMAQVSEQGGTLVWSDRIEIDVSGGIAEEERISALLAARLRDKFIAAKSEQTDRKIAAAATSAVSARTPDPAAQRQVAFSPKSRLVTALLVLVPFTGILGFHRFYIGRPFTGLLYVFTGGFALAGWIMDITLMAAGVLADGKGRPVVFWRRAKARAGIAGDAAAPVPTT